MADVIVKIDGDTTSYDSAMDRSVAKTKELGAAVKEAHGPFKELGGFSKEVLAAMTGVAVPFGLSAAVIGVIDGFITNFHGKMERTRDVMRDVAALHERMASAGMGGQSAEITTAMRKAAPNLKNTEIGDVFGGTTSAGGIPGATTPQLAEAARAAQTAQLAGLRDIGGFAKTRASLISSGVANADADAYYLERYAPDTKDDALGAIRKYPDQAEDISRLYQAAGREEGKGQKGLKEIIQKALGEYGLEKATNPNMTSSFMDAMKGTIGIRTAFESGGRAGELNRQFLLGQVAQPLDYDEMQRNAESNEKDPVSRAHMTIKRNEAAGDDILQADNGAKLLGHDKRDSRYKALGMENGLASGPYYNAALLMSSVAGLITGTRTEGQRMVEYIENGGDMQYSEFAARDASARNQKFKVDAEARGTKHLIEVMNRRRLQSHNTQNGDK